MTDCTERRPPFPAAGRAAMTSETPAITGCPPHAGRVGRTAETQP